MASTIRSSLFMRYSYDDLPTVFYLQLHFLLILFQLKYIVCLPIAEVSQTAGTLFKHDKD